MVEYAKENIFESECATIICFATTDGIIRGAKGIEIQNNPEVKVIISDINATRYVLLGETDVCFCSAENRFVFIAYTLKEESDHYKLDYTALLKCIDVLKGEVNDYLTFKNRHKQFSKNFKIGLSFDLLGDLSQEETEDVIKIFEREFKDDKLSLVIYR